MTNKILFSTDIVEYFEKLNINDPKNVNNFNNPIKILLAIEKPPYVSFIPKNKKFYFCNEDYLDVLNLTKKFQCNNLFGYYLANVFDTTNINSPTIDILIYLYGNTKNKTIILNESIPENNITKEKFKVYTDFVFYMFSLELYTPNPEINSSSIFQNYINWIKETTMKSN